jgi:hypothetical protein
LKVTIRVIFAIVIPRGGKILSGILAGSGLVFLLSGCFERMNLPERDGSGDPSHEDVFQEDLDTVPDRTDVPDMGEDAVPDEILPDIPDSGEDVQVD